MTDEDMRKELQNIQLKMNATTDEVNQTSGSRPTQFFFSL